MPILNLLFELQQNNVHLFNNVSMERQDLSFNTGLLIGSLHYVSCVSLTADRFVMTSSFIFLKVD